MQSNKYYIFGGSVCSLIYPACNAHVPYYIVACGLSESTVISTLSHKEHDFRKKVTEQKFPFLFSLQLLSETFLSLRKTLRYQI